MTTKNPLMIPAIIPTATDERISDILDRPQLSDQTLLWRNNSDYNHAISVAEFRDIGLQEICFVDAEMMRIGERHHDSYLGKIDQIVVINLSATISAVPPHAPEFWRFGPKDGFMVR